MSWVYICLRFTLCKYLPETIMVSLDIGRIVLDAGKVVLDTGKVVLDTGKVVLDTGKIA